jgi:NADH dehydrogenase FAD-containing subunit
VADPFGRGGLTPVSFAEVAHHCRAELHAGTAAGIEPDDRVAITEEGDRLAFHALVVAVGARAAVAVPGALVFAGPHDVPALDAGS